MGHFTAGELTQINLDATTLLYLRSLVEQDVAENGSDMRTEVAAQVLGMADEHTN